MRILATFHPTPFCNLNCDYCWAPNRSDTTRMPLALVARALDQIHSNSDLEGMDVLWLTGEPLVLGIDYFRKAVELCLEKSQAADPPKFIIQTNGTLIDDQWCEFFAEHDFIVGVSIDGPEAIHDRHRRSRLGKPTFQDVERGIDLLVQKGVKGGAICVITKATLESSPDDLFRYFYDKGIAWSYLIEAPIGQNADSTTGITIDDEPAVERFLSRLLDLWAEYPDSYIRDFEQTSRRVFGGSQPRPDSDNLGCLDILNVSADGSFYWGNPELMSAVYGPLQSVRFNLFDDHIWHCRSTETFIGYQAEIHRGVRKCREACAYFEGCQGGNPAHKFYEFGSFDVSRHRSCELNDQIVQTLMLRKLGEDIHR